MYEIELELISKTFTIENVNLIIDYVNIYRNDISYLSILDKKIISQTYNKYIKDEVLAQLVNYKSCISIDPNDICND